ncbi:MAG: alpha/beta fold hydrolase [Bdellovibrionia bacterium]
MKHINMKKCLNFLMFPGAMVDQRLKISFALGLLCILPLSSAQAVSESDFKKNFQKHVLPHYQLGQRGNFKAQDGIKISYRTFEIEDEEGALVILPGCGIPILGYAELIYDLRELGLSVYVLDHRGQGDSDKVAVDPQVTHVGDFDHYVTDVAQFMDTVVNKKPHVRKFLLGESMGCAIGTQYLLKNPDAFSAVILSTPMFGLNTGYMPQYLTHCVAQAGCMLGLGEYYAPRTERYRRRSFDENTVTQSQARFELAQDILEKHTQFQLGGVTYQWVSTSLSTIVQIQTNQIVFNLPLMVFKAGKDQIIRNDAIGQFCKIQENCKLVEFTDSCHGLLMEADTFRDQAVAEIKAFIHEHKELPAPDSA